MSKMQWLDALSVYAAARLAAHRRSGKNVSNGAHTSEELERRVLLSVSFHPQQTFPSGTDPQSVAVADLNGDGKPDMVVANFADNNVGVLLGNGNGTFGTQHTFPTGLGPNGVIIADVNRDGIPDIIVANRNSDDVSVLLGKGDGTFFPQQTYPVGMGPRSVVVADFNSDGKLDLAVANNVSNDVSVLLGNGDGTFQAQTSEAGALGADSIAVGDYNGDGKMDIVTVGLGESGMVEDAGAGNGSFSVLPATMLPNPAAGVAVGDINGDGKEDVVVALYAGNAVDVLLGTGNGTFTVSSPDSTGAGSSPAFIKVADVNGDGIPDVIVTTANASIDVLLGSENSFPFDGMLGPANPFPTGSYPSAFAVADVNGDASPDLIVPNFGDNDVSVLLNDPLATISSINRNTPAVRSTQSTSVTWTVNFTEPVTGVIPANFSPQLDAGMASGDPVVSPTSGPASSYSVTVNDITGSGNISLLYQNTYTIVNDTGNLLETYLNFRQQPDVDTPADAIAIADMNGDGYPDAVSTNPNDNEVFVSLNGGVNTLNNLESGQGFPINNGNEGEQPNAVATADLNDDGKIDVVTANEDGTVSVMLGNGNGTLQAPQVYSAGGTSSNSIVIADVNGDGIPDLIVSNGASDTVGVLLGNGNGTFQPVQTLATGQSPDDVAVADVNGDGLPDIIVSNSGDDTIGVFLGVRTGSPGGFQFASQQTFGAGGNPAEFQVADLNGDGKLDLLVDEPANNALATLLGNGDGTFGTPIISNSFDGLSSVKLADISGDGRLDAIGIDDADNSFAYMLGDGDGTFQDEILHGSPSGQTLAVADMNEDGLPDGIVGTAGAIRVEDDFSLEDSFQGESFAILKRDATLSFTGATVVFDGNPHPATFTAIGANGEDLSSEVSLSYTNTADNTTSANPPTQLGRYEVFASFTGDGSYNAISQFDTGKAIVISAHPLSNATLTVTGADALFDGNPHPAAITATGVSGEDLSSLASLTYTDTANNTSSATPPTQVGTYEVFASFAGNDNYNAVASFDTGKSVVISPLSQLQSVPSGKLPTASLIAGQTIKPIHLNVALANNGASAVAELVTVNVTLSSSAGGAPQDPVVGTISKTVKLKSHQTAAFGSILIKSLPEGLSGTEHLVFKLTDSTGAANLASDGTISVGPASNDLAALSVGAPPKASLGKKFTATVAVMQNGNIPFNGTLPAELFLSTTSTIGAGAIDLGTASGHISIQPGKKANFHLSTAIPSSVATGSYFLLVQLDPANTLSDVNLANNIIASVKIVPVS